MAARTTLVSFALLLLAGCAPGSSVEPPEGALLAAVPVADHAELSGELARFAHENGLYYRDSSHSIAMTTGGSVTTDMSAFRQLEDGSEWEEIKAIGSGGEAPVVMFQDPPDRDMQAQAESTRRALARRPVERWPGSGAVPIVRSDIPDVRDLVRTPAGLRIDRRKARDYGLPPDSPLLAR